MPNGRASDLHSSSVPDSTPTRRTAAPATTARLALGATGPAIPVREHLRFQLDHALARDAVHTALDTGLLTRGLRERGLNPALLQSQAGDRATYLRRPDLGRTLHPDSVAALEEHRQSRSSRPESASFADGAERPAALPPQGSTLFLLADGLSSLALERHALPLLDAVLPLLVPYPLSLVPILTNARVALADQIGQLLHAQITVLLIGERPGLSSPDSLGCYITWNPQPGKTTDAERNCISNIRGAEGLSYAEAAHRIAHYIAEATRLHTTGIALKDPTPTPNLPISERNPL
jgi:ethanolamine ammonia-lyase small subunit